MLNSSIAQFTELVSANRSKKLPKQAWLFAKSRRTISRTLSEELPVAEASTDLLDALEHDHVPLSRLVAELRVLLQQDTLENDRLLESMGHLRDELLDHFGREEELFFPFLAAAVPSIANELAALAAAHDAICGSLTRLVYLLQREPLGVGGPDGVQLRALFGRFDAAYCTHASDEVVLLRRAGLELNATQRHALRDAARGLF